jgi:VWFA-related protein
MRTTLLLCFLSLALNALGAAFAQTPAPGQLATPAKDVVIRAGSNEVMLDVVVRDKKGQRVVNLEPGDLQILDNGVERKITSFKLIQGAGSFSAAAELENRQAAATGPTPPPRKLDPLSQIRLVTLIFNRLDLNARTIARQAALDLLKNEFPQNVYMGVLVLGDSLQGIQPFTNDLGLLRKAVERATSGAYTEFASDSARIQAQMQQQLGPATAGESLGEQQQAMTDATGGSGGKGPSGDPAGAAMSEMMMNMLLLTRSTELAQTGRSAIWGLIDAVSQQYRLPGRKSILFFSSGFGIPQGMEEPWKELISTANRFNVTFYSIDARGLGTSNLNTDANSQLRDGVSASAANLRKGTGRVTPAMAQSMDTAINAGKANGQNTLADLAESTGGFLIANTNDFRNQLKKVSEDIQTYYQLTYDPSIDKYDGAFHKIEVVALRPNLRIQARSGYFALPSAASAGVVLAPYELPLLNALNSTPLPRNFNFQSAGVHFKTGAEQTGSVILDVPISNLTLKQSTPASPFEGGLTYLVLVRDANREVIKKFHGEVPIAANPDQLTAIQQSHFLYHEPMDLAPGRYTLESVVADKLSEKVSARKSVFLVPVAGAKLSMSSVTIVRSLNMKGENTSAQDPFLMAGKVINPVISPAFKKTDSNGLSFYLVVYPDKANTAKPQLSMQFSRDGEPLGAGSPTLGDADESGRIQYIATAPIDKLPPGNYAVEFLVKQGAETATESVYFTLE